MNEMDELARMRASVPADTSGGRAQSALLEAIRAEQAGIPAPARRPGYDHGRATLGRRAMLAGTAGIAACAALAVTALLPGGTGNDAGTVRLAAWTVQRDPGGTIKITISELRDAAGLQATLRADGVPANVVFSQTPFEGTTSSSALPPSCAVPDMSGKDSAMLSAKIMPFTGPPTPGQNSVALTINSSAIPPGIGVFIKAFAASPGTENGPIFSMENDLVMTSPQCTGS